MTRRSLVTLAIAPLILTPLIFTAVLRSGSSPAPLARRALPEEPFTTERCNWACHNRGCRHPPRLPGFLTGDDGLFGWAVRGLHAMGDVLSPGDGGVGYGAANLLVFCAAWPGAMFGLWVLGLSTRCTRRSLEDGAQRRPAQGRLT